MARTMYTLLVNFPNGGHGELVNYTGSQRYGFIDIACVIFV